MNQDMHASVRDSIRDFSLPLYSEIPNVGLYLEQTSKYITEYLSYLGDFNLTGSMISNYVKQGLIASPVKKQYSREQIAYLFFIALAKTVLSMDDIRMMFDLQKGSYTPQTAYEYLRLELGNVLDYVFGVKDTLDAVGVDDTLEKDILRNTIITIAHKVYLDKFLNVLHQSRSENS